MLVPKINKVVYLSDILAFLRSIYEKVNFNEDHERGLLIQSMDGKIYKEYTKGMFKDKSIEIHYDIREMREEGILPKEFIVIDDFEGYY